MSSYLSKSFIKEMLEAVDLADFLENEYNYVLSKKTSKSIMLCPFHNDTNPSMSIANNKFKCWACGESGDLLTFLMKKEGLSFPEALKRLSVLAGISLEEDGGASHAVREINAIIEEYLNRGGSTHFPGGLSEPQFLLLLAERIKQYERKHENDPDIFKWCDNIYMKFDDLLFDGKTTEIKKAWANLPKLMQERRLMAV